MHLVNESARQNVDYHDRSASDANWTKWPEATRRRDGCCCHGSKDGVREEGGFRTVWVMAHSPASIANFFINKAKEEGAELTALKLQKLVYYTAGYYSAYTGRPLLNCSIEAWEYGPVVPELYREFREFGGSPITRLAPEHPFTDDPAPIPTNDKEAMGIADFVWKNYKNYSALTLSEMTHQNGSPWQMARDARPGVRNADIEERLLVDHFKKFIAKKAG